MLRFTSFRLIVIVYTYQAAHEGEYLAEGSKHGRVYDPHGRYEKSYRDKHSSEYYESISHKGLDILFHFF